MGTMMKWIDALLAVVSVIVISALLIAATSLVPIVALRIITHIPVQRLCALLSPPTIAAFLYLIGVGILWKRELNRIQTHEGDDDLFVIRKGKSF